jgi:hypothetical protein
MSFSGDIRKFNKKFEKRYRAVFRGSAQDVTYLANVPIAQGGRMPVDTGFLRASQSGKVGSMPDGSQSVAAALASWDIGDTFYSGWTANYAIYMEYRYGFNRGAAEQWGAIVKQNVAKAKAGGL